MKKVTGKILFEIIYVLPLALYQALNFSSLVEKFGLWDKSQTLYIKLKTTQIHHTLFDKSVFLLFSKIFDFSYTIKKGLAL